MFISNSIHPYFTQNHKFKPHGGVKGNVKITKVVRIHHERLYKMLCQFIQLLLSYFSLDQSGGPTPPTSLEPKKYGVHAWVQSSDLYFYTRQRRGYTEWCEKPNRYIYRTKESCDQYMDRWRFANCPMNYLINQPRAISYQSQTSFFVPWMLNQTKQRTD